MIELYKQMVKEYIKREANKKEEDTIDKYIWIDESLRDKIKKDLEGKK